MIAWEELDKLDRKFGITGLWTGIVSLAEEIAKLYDVETQISRTRRELLDQMQDVELDLEAEAIAEGKNERERTLLLKRKKREHTEYTKLERELSRVEAELEELRTERNKLQHRMNARRAVCYLLGSVLDAVHALRVYERPQEEKKEVVDDEEIPF